MDDKLRKVQGYQQLNKGLYVVRCPKKLEVLISDDADDKCQMSW
jgi:hypothetical protein